MVGIGIGVGWVQWWNGEALPRLDQRDRSLDRLGSGLNSEIEQRMRLLSAVVGGDELEKLQPLRWLSFRERARRGKKCSRLMERVRSVLG